MGKKLLVCDVEGTIFKADFRIEGTNYHSTMWQPLAKMLDEYNLEHGINHTDTVEKERIGNELWENGEFNSYLDWVEYTIKLHIDNQMNKYVFNTVLQGAEYQNGVKEFFKNLDTDKFVPVLISGGFQELMERAQKELVDKDGKPIIKHGFAACRYIWEEKKDEEHSLLKAWSIQPSDFKDKYSYLKIILEQYNLNETSDWIFIGDGKNDADIASRAPISFAITPHPELAAVATYTIDSFMEIKDILNSDESERALSKKRGLSNKQSVIVGQRLINAGELETVKYTDNFKTEKSTLKYRLYASVSPIETAFSEMYKKIIEWCESYADNADRFRNDLTEYNNSNSFIYEYNGIAKIKIATIKTDTEKEMGVHINSQDVGTELRQAVLGGTTDIHIGIFQKAGEKAKLKIDIATKLPINSYVKKHSIPLETYCPMFVKEMCKMGFVIKADGEKRLSFNIEKLDGDKIIKILNEKERFFPLVFIYDIYCDNDLSKIASYTFGFAKVYKCDLETMNEIVELLNLQKKEIAGAIVSFPKDYNVEPRFYNDREITKPKSDAIGYKDNKRILYSTSEGEGKITAAINISDYVIEECEKHFEIIDVNDSILYYNSISKKISENNILAMLQHEKIQSTDNILKNSQNAVKERKIDFEKIEKLKAAVDKDLSDKSGEIRKFNGVLTGMKEFLEKGELILALQHDIIGNPNEKIPLSILQPIACAFEIGVNIWLYCLEKEKYFKIKENNAENGKILRYLEYDSGTIDYYDEETKAILREANDCRNDSAHPNEMRTFNEINGIEKEKLYKGIELVAQKICRLDKNS